MPGPGVVWVAGLGCPGEWAELVGRAAAVEVGEKEAPAPEGMVLVVGEGGEAVVAVAGRNRDTAGLLLLLLPAVCPARWTGKRLQEGHVNARCMSLPHQLATPTATCTLTGQRHGHAPDALSNSTCSALSPQVAGFTTLRLSTHPHGEPRVPTCRPVCCHHLCLSGGGCVSHHSSLQHHVFRAVDAGHRQRGCTERVGHAI